MATKDEVHSTPKWLYESRRLRLGWAQPVSRAQEEYEITQQLTSSVTSQHPDTGLSFRF